MSQNDNNRRKRTQLCLGLSIKDQLKDGKCLKRNDSKKWDKKKTTITTQKSRAGVILYYFIYLLYNVITIQICWFKYKNSVNKD